MEMSAGIQELSVIEALLQNWHDTVQLMHCERDMLTTAEQAQLQEDSEVENKGY